MYTYIYIYRERERDMYTYICIYTYTYTHILVCPRRGRRRLAVRAGRGALLAPARAY